MSAPAFLAPRVLLDGMEVDLAAVLPGAHIALEGSEARHAVKVQRLRGGERVDLVDGAGFRARAAVAPSASPDELAVEVLEVQQDAPRTPRLVLVQALAKGGRDEQAIETATELGVDGVVPWEADRSIVRWTSQKVAKALDRWEKVLVAATKQSRRAGVPRLEQPVSSRQLTERIEEWTAEGGVVLVCHEEASASLPSAIASAFGQARADAEARGPLVIVVGPEGGVSSEELAAFEGAGATPVLLGPEVLRSSTAGPAALAVANVLLGRWGAL